MPSLTTVLSGVLAFAATALAYTEPTTFNVTTNPIYTPNEGDIVPAGKPYKITWGPTNTGTVSIILLRGPSENAEPLYAIVEKIANSGSYTWTPKTDLEDDESRYGLQLIIDASGQYQYSTQFGISNPNYEAPSSSSSAATGYETGEPTTTSYATVDVTTKSYETSLVTVTTPHNNTTTAYIPTYTPPSDNSTATYTPPTASEEPTEEPTDSTTAPVPSQTGAAASIKVASGLLLGVAGVAAMLL